MNEIPRDIVDNRNLFSNYFLENILPTLPEWSDEAHRATLEDFRQKYATERRFLPDLNEAQLEERFFRPLLRILGFTTEVQEGIHEALDFPDYALFESRRELDRAHLGSHQFYDRALGIAEVKRWDIKLDRFGRDRHNKQKNPSYQIWHYLRLTKPRWGILSNGRKWRLYHQDRPMESYFEVDLARILEEGDVDSFRYFYYFFRKEAFLPKRELEPFLERVLHGSEDYAREVGENLKENVYRALQVLAQGFFDRPENDLDLNRETDVAIVQQNVMRLLYRLLFILYAEGKELLGGRGYLESSYSLYRLKHEIAERRDTGELILPTTRVHWYQLRELFELIDRGSDAFGISRKEFYVPAYNGGLFDPEMNKFLEEVVVGDRYVAEALDLLARAPGDDGHLGFVDYSTLDIRHLGSIYEGLLEYRLQVAHQRMVAVGKKPHWTTYEDYKRGLNKPRRFINFDRHSRVEQGDLFVQTHKGERKATGSYYTPHYVVESIVRNALEPIIERKWKEAREKSQPLRDATLSIRTLDPAMGSGHFLVGVVRFLAEKLLEAIAEDLERKLISEEETGGYTPGWAKRAVLANCIYGVDLNQLAVELSKVSLWLETISKDKPLSFLDHRLKHGDSLIGTWLEELAFYPAEFLAGPSGRARVVDGQKRLEVTPFLENLREMLREIEAIGDETRGNIEAKKEIFDELIKSEEYSRIKLLADVRAGIFFGARPSALSDAGRQYGNLTWAIIEGDKRQWAEEIRSGWRHHALLKAKELAFFHWELEFPVVFSGRNPGFDIVIGNPPYLTFRAVPDTMRDYYRTSFGTFQMKGDVYILFLERASRLSRRGGITGLIVQNKFLSANYAKKFRRMVLDRETILRIVNFNDSPVFDITAYPLILLRRQGKPAEDHQFSWIEINEASVEATQLTLIEPKVEFVIRQTSLREGTWYPQSQLGSMGRETVELGSFAKQIGRGAAPGNTSVFVVNDKLTVSKGFERQFLLRVLRGGDVDRFSVTPAEDLPLLIYPYEIRDRSPDLVSESQIPAIIDYLSEFRKELETRKNYGKRIVEQGYAWYELTYASPGMLHPKILFPDISASNRFALDAAGEIACMDTVYFLVRNEQYSEHDSRFLVAYLNSKFSNFLFEGLSPKIRGGYRRYKSQYVRLIPVPRLSFTTPAEERNRAFQELKSGFEESIAAVDSLFGEFVAEIANREIPDDIVHDFMSWLTSEITALKEGANRQSSGFLEWLASPAGLGIELDELSGKTKVKAFHRSSRLGSPAALAELEGVLKKNGIRLNPEKLREFRAEYARTSKQLKLLLKKIRRIDLVLDVLVYRIFGVSLEHIAKIEDCSPEEASRRYQLYNSID